MEVKHQVFVSSTYRDLVEERKAVIHALLELDCIPAGMELFPAADEDAWTLIKEVIDDCDYYILILAGKYGSTKPDGLGYTEMEFDYAVSKNKPVLAFLHENIETLSAANVEKTEALRERLLAFRKKAESKHCKFWNGPEDLGGKVSRSLVQLRKRHPSSGWIPGKYAATDAMMRELAELRAKVTQYEIDGLLGTADKPVDTEDFAQGQDLVYLEVDLKEDKAGKEKSVPLKCTWDQIFAYCGPSMMGECSDSEMMSRVQLAFWHMTPERLRSFNKWDEIIVPYVVEDQIRVQLQALGLIAPGIKRRAVSDTATYWRLTPYGQKYLLRITAKRRAKPSTKA